MVVGVAESRMKWSSVLDSTRLVVRSYIVPYFTVLYCTVLYCTTMVVGKVTKVVGYYYLV